MVAWPEKRRSEGQKKEIYLSKYPRRSKYNYVSWYRYENVYVYVYGTHTLEWRFLFYFLSFLLSLFLSECQQHIENCAWIQHFKIFRILHPIGKEKCRMLIISIQRTKLLILFADKVETLFKKKIFVDVLFIFIFLGENFHFSNRCQVMIVSFSFFCSSFLVLFSSYSISCHHLFSKSCLK